MIMKKSMYLIVLVLFMIGVSACGKSTEPEATPTNEVSMDDVLTAVVLTLTEEASHFSPTPEPTSTETSTVSPVPTSTTAQSSPTPAATKAVISNITANGCNDAVYVSDVTIPDGTTMSAGQSFTKTWSIKNSGTCNWATDYKLVYISGDKMSASDTTIGSAVPVGNSGSISVSMVAPSTAGTYTSYWQMADASGNKFGGQVYVMIKVGSSSGTSTVTATGATATKTNTSASTAAPTNTTAASTATFTEIPPTQTETPTS
jgi:hypothetical protein